MKKYFLLLLTAITASLMVQAGIANLPNGYYRVVNHYTGRGIQVMDNTGELIEQQATADMRAIVLHKGDDVVSDPATVLYVEKHGDKYDITGQSTGIYQMIKTYVNIIDSRKTTGSYWAYGSKGSMTLYLFDAFTSLDRTDSYLATKGDDRCKDWDIIPVEAGTDNYFGVKPTLSAGGKYYQPFFADFPFSFAGTGMKAYYICKVDERNGYVVYKEITGTVPASTPVVIECSSDQPVNNKLNVGGSASAINDNVAKGVYFEFHLKNHNNFVTYDKSKMRSMGVLADGTLGVVTGDYEDVPRNQFYIPVSGNAPATMKFVSQEEYDRLVVQEPIEATGVTLSANALTMDIGQQVTLTATVSPDDATDKTVTWTSSNTSVASVTPTGIVTAYNAGQTTITATCGKVSATCVVTVNPIPVTGVSLNKTELTLNVGQQETLVATVTPANASNKNVTWSSSNTSVASVTPNGIVTAYGAGQAVITATCGDCSATCTVTVNGVDVTGISLNKTELALNVGQQETLVATVTPSNATNKNVTWTSSNTSVASVTPNGIVTAYNAGQTIITATCGNFSATCTVTVTAPEIAVESITLNKTELTLNIGDQETLVATVSPANATDKNVTWASSNTSVASVTPNGIVTAYNAGQTTITATCGNFSATCTVTVNAPVVAVESITLDKTELSLKVGERETLVATVLPENATDKKVTWKSSNTSVASVTQSGKVIAYSVGEAVITASCGEVSATCNVTVSAVEAESITLNVSELTLAIGATETLTATVLPENAADKTVTWTSSNETVATVDSEGKVTAVALGDAVITATCGNVSAKCTVKVKAVEAESITLNKRALDLKIGESETLIATVRPENTSDPTVVWFSSSPSVATVDENGKVTAISVGKATITASCGIATTYCNVTVSPVSATSVTLNKTELELNLNESETLVATIEPSDTTNPELVWSSSDESVATVDDSGKVTAVAVGEAVITVTCGEILASCVVTVLPIEAEEIELNLTEVSVYINAEVQLTATVKPADTTYPQVVWTSSDMAVATVDETGKVVAVGVGIAQIKAVCGKAEAICTVTVLPILAEEVTLNETAVTIEKDDTIQLEATVSPADTTDATIVWTSSDETVATVDQNGIVTAIAEGTAIITAACGEASATCEVTVTDNGGISGVLVDTDGTCDVYNVQGIKVRSNATDLNGLPRGIYIVNGQKVYIR